MKTLCTFDPRKFKFKKITSHDAKIDTEYDRAKVPPYNGNDPPPALGSLKVLLFPPLLNNVQTRERKGYKRGTARNFLHSFPLSGAPVVQSFCVSTKRACFKGSRTPCDMGISAGCFSAYSWRRPAYSCVWEFSCFQLELLYLQFEFAFCLQLQFFWALTMGVCL